jgi:hypothetical protein
MLSAGIQSIKHVLPDYALYQTVLLVNTFQISYFTLCPVTVFDLYGESHAMEKWLMG